MKNRIYWQGIPGSFWGIWDVEQGRFLPGIEEDTPMLAQARLYQKIGQTAKAKRYEARQLPKHLVPMYACDPEKNERCNKTACFKHGGPCYWTRQREFAQEVLFG